MRTGVEPRYFGGRVEATRGLCVIVLVSLAAIGLTANATSNVPGTLIITSDVHVSHQSGRWPYTTAQYKAFIQSLDDPEIVFNVGDIVDNVVYKPDGVSAGGMGHWKIEVRYFQEANQSLPGTTFLHSYGPGHDWIADVKLEDAERASGILRRGLKKWGNVDLIWFTVYPAAFRNAGKNRAALSKDDYEWLQDVLSNSDNAILLWHVPIRTPDTEQLGKWPGEQNLTIPHEDKLYAIIDSHQRSILAIFNGHIHKAAKSSYKGIAVYLCPFFRTGCYCELIQSGRSIMVTPKNCDIAGAEIKTRN